MVSGNQLSGTLPGALGRCTKLVQLRAQNNRLTGPLPATLGACVQLQSLHVDEALLVEGLPEPLRQRHADQLLKFNQF